MLPQRFYVHGQPAHGDRHVYAQRTRFIPKSILGLFEKTAWRPPGPSETVDAAGQRPRFDVAEKLRNMWAVG